MPIGATAPCPATASTDCQRAAILAPCASSRAAAGAGCCVQGVLLELLPKLGVEPPVPQRGCAVFAGDARAMLDSRRCAREARQRRGLSDAVDDDERSACG